MDEGRSADGEDGNGDGEGHEWQFSVEDLDRLQEEREREQTVEPGSPRLEHALFVLLGVLATLFAIFRALVA